MTFNLFLLFLFAFVLGFVAGVFYAVKVINSIANEHKEKKQAVKPWPADARGVPVRRFDDTKPETRPGPTAIKQSESTDTRVIP